MWSVTCNYSTDMSLIVILYNVDTNRQLICCLYVACYYCCNEYLLLLFFCEKRSQIRYIWQYTLSQDLRSSMRLPLQTARPCWLQYRQIACCTNLGKVLGNDGLNCRASIL